MRGSAETVRRALKQAGLVLNRPDPDYAVNTRCVKTPATI
jgi:hypothetical protein